jgi:aquaporin related protein
VAQAIGHVSGGHINPAVTLGVMVAGQMSIVRGVLYMVAQYLGGIAGAGLLRVATPSAGTAGFSAAAQGLGGNALQSGVSPGQGVLVEAMVTFLLVIVVFGVCDSRRDDVKGSIPLAIGLTVGISHLVAIGFTGTGMNPARSLGPAVINPSANFHGDLWVYFVGPYVGGAAAGILYSVLFKARGTSESVDF